MPNPNFRQWLYRGQRPNWIARILNLPAAIVATSGITGNYMETLEVIGRKSGRVISLPVVIALVEGQRYLVSMLGDKAQWVLNVRAAGGQAVMHSGRRTTVQLENVPIHERAPILKAYLKRAPGARPHMLVDKDAPLVEFEKIAADYPVFQIVANPTIAH